MNNHFRRFLSLLLALTLVLSLLPGAAFAENAKAENEPARAEAGEAPVYVEGGASDELWDAITALENEKILNVCGTNATAKDYANLTDDVLRLVESSDSFVEGSVIRHGDFFYWTSTDGQVNGYSPRLRSQVRASAVPDADPEAFAGTETVSFVPKGGGPNSKNVAVFQPYYGIDTSFTTQYKDEGTSIAQATGGTSTAYLTTNATIDNIASAIQNCAVVIFDSHGDTDYYVSGSEDYVTKANTSYLCLQSGTGLTTADQASVTGDYGTYYHAYYAGSNGSMKYYCVDGTAITNHMSGNACHNLVWMAICLGMATTGMHVPFRNKGVEVVFGHSQSTTFTGDYQYEEDFWGKMKSGETVATAFAYMTRTQKWDPAYYSQYNTLAKARYNYCAFPNIVSSEDTYQGHRTKNPSSASDSSANNNNDPNYGACNCQTVYSTWSLFGSNYNVTATSNNTAWGTVSVDGSIITASPKTGYYAAGYTVTSGTAEVTQNGNVFHVNPSSDCTVQINFAAKTPAVVTYMANGVQAGTVSSYVGDEITLPSSAAEADGWTFSGWMTQELGETTDKPTYWKPGAGYTVNAASVTLYALYIRTESGGEMGYELVTEAPDDWAGNYVISYGIDTGMYLMKGVAPSSNGAQIENSSNCATYANAGVSLEDNVLHNVADDYLFTLAPSGSYYTVKSVSKNSYLGLASNSYLGAYTSYSANYCDWTPGVGDNASGMMSAFSGSYPYLSFTTSSGYFWSGSSLSTSIRLWKGTELGTKYYTTSPVEIVPVDYTVTFTTPDGITAPAPMTMNNVTGGTLPTAGAPDGYTFLGWVTEDYDNVTEKPAQILTGTYRPQADVTLKALYTYSVAGGTAPMLTQMTTSDTLADGDKIVITASGTDVALYQATVNNTYVNKYTFDNRADTVLADAKNYLNVTTASNGWYLGDDANGYLYTSGSNNLAVNTSSSKTVWTLTTLNGYLALKGNNRYLSYRNDLSNAYWRMGGTGGTSGICTLVIYKLTEGEASIARYTTIIINEPAHVHDVAYFEGQPATCTQDGVRAYYYCNDTACELYGRMFEDEELTVEITDAVLPALGHDLVADTVVAPTCTEEGYTVYKCSRCDFEDVADVTDALGHDFTVEPAPTDEEHYLAPTCTEAGLKYLKCSRCDVYSSEAVELPALGHDLVADTVVAPTCTEEGYTVYKCSRCDFEDMDDVTDALGHDFGEWTVSSDSTCTEGGTESRTCTRCGETETREIASLGHNPGQPARENEIAPTCTEVGGYDMVTRCTRCGEILSTEHTELEALGHTPAEPVKENETAPTCTEAGSYDEVVFCSVCGEELSRESVAIEALGHEWDDGHITTEPTMTEEGVRTYTCLRCGETKTEAIPTLAFRFDDVQDESKFYFEPVYWAYFHDPQITTGTSATLFSPGKACTRGQVVTFLWRALGEPAPTQTTHSFTDVKESAYYYKAMLWAVENEITTGTSTTTFSPNKTATRGQVVTFLWRALGKPAYSNAVNHFTDVKEGAYYYDAVLWAVENKIASGISSKNFAPNTSASRGHVVTFLYRAIKPLEES